jgi:hypothetical protein
MLTAADCDDGGGDGAMVSADDGGAGVVVGQLLVMRLVMLVRLLVGCWCGVLVLTRR